MCHRYSLSTLDGCHSVAYAAGNGKSLIVESVVQSKCVNKYAYTNGLMVDHTCLVACMMSFCHLIVVL